MSEDRAKCEICGEPMPVGEEMFKFHGYSGDCPKPPLKRVPSGAELIAAERQRQIDVEGYTAEHDDEHEMGELAAAAMCYTQTAVDGEIREVGSEEFYREWWPFEEIYWKPSDTVRNLVKAGSFIAAEIDRLQRNESPSGQQTE